MQDYFEHEFSQMEKELTQLKTSMLRSASEIAFEKKSIQVNIPLSLNSSQTSANGSVVFQVNSNSTLLVFPTLSQYYDDISLAGRIPNETRWLQVNEGMMNDGTELIEVYGNGTQTGTNNDVETLINGGSVTLNATLTVYATDSFTLEQIS